MKTGPQRKYFSGKLSDGNSAIRFISFAPRTLDVVPACEAISAFKGKPVVVENCEVKTNSYGGAPELIVSNFTSFDESSKVFGEKNRLRHPILLKFSVSQLSSVEEYSPISIKIGVLRVDPYRTTSSGTPMQTVAVADATGATTVDLWAQFIDQLKPNICYTFSSFRNKIRSQRRAQKRKTPARRYPGPHLQQIRYKGSCYSRRKLPLLAIGTRNTRKRYDRCFYLCQYLISIQVKT